MKNNTGTDIDVGTKTDSENTFPINFQLLPKRFMIWDTLHEAWLAPYGYEGENRTYVFNTYDLLCRLDLVKIGVKDQKYILVQSTGTFDEDGEEIWEGSMARDYDGQIGVVYYDAGEGGYWVKAMNGDSWQLADTNLMKVMGHFLSNPNLILETKNGH